MQSRFAKINSKCAEEARNKKKKNTSGNRGIENCSFIWVISLCTVGKMVIKNAKIRLFHFQFIPEQMFSKNYRLGLDF